MAQQDPVAAIRAAIARHPRLGNGDDIRISVADGVVTLEGTVERIAPRRLIPRLAAETTGLGIDDRLRLAAKEPRDDASIRADLVASLESDPLFSGYAIAPDGATGGEREIVPEVTDSVVRLHGRVESLLHRRMAEVRAWWTRGATAVDNRLQVQPAEQDSDAAITEAVRAALERDPRVDASRIGVRTDDRVVMLIGVQSEPGQRLAAAQDAWFVAGVHEVDNRIRVLDWRQLDLYADEASRASFPASDPPAFTPIVGVGGTAGERPAAV
ncbi:MAG TPA: BON domain-containing protein [Woeseiaceae bacterium]|nr:BON domain-containing protein [Woeseiaceae bacterium]